MLFDLMKIERKKSPLREFSSYEVKVDWANPPAGVELIEMLWEVWRMEDGNRPAARVEGLIHVIRGQRMMLSADLARLYGVPSKALIQAVNRNEARFPPDFMFRLTRPEIRDRSHVVTCAPIARARNVLAFAEQGVAMLSSVLQGERAVQVDTVTA